MIKFDRKLSSYLLKVFLMSVGFVGLLGLVGLSYFVGYTNGAQDTSIKIQSELESYLANVSSISYPTPTPRPEDNQPLTKTPAPTQQPARIVADWGGPQLWDAVNARRQEFGVNALQSKSELCTIASIRLNELLELGKLDGHEGFSTMPETRPDLKWIFETYSISEFLVSGADSPEQAVALWENTLGHKKLLTGGEYVWGCIYAQNTIGVAIAAY